MHSLGPRDMLEAWEQGRNQPGHERPLTLLAAAGENRDDLRTLSLGERDARLLQLWHDAFGPRLESYAECPDCSERLEFTLSADELLRARPSDEPLMLPWKDQELLFRMPNTADLAAAFACADPGRARRLIAERCVLDEVALSAAAVAKLAERMEKADPRAEILLDLTCPECDHAWKTLFDISDFLWTEVASTAQRLLYEVHLLASRYGWTESEILLLSPARRRAYLEMPDA